MPSQEGASASQDKLLSADEEQEAAENAAGTFIPEEESQFELDTVNQHWCMKNIKRCIERMKVLFGEEWRDNSQ